MTDKKTPIFDSLQARYAAARQRADASFETARLELDFILTGEPRQPQTRRDLRDGLRNMKPKRVRKPRPRYRRKGIGE
jgi:hypothetical protein